MVPEQQQRPLEVGSWVHRGHTDPAPYIQSHLHCSSPIALGLLYIPEPGCYKTPLLSVPVPNTQTADPQENLDSLLQKLRNSSKKLEHRGLPTHLGKSPISPTMGWGRKTTVLPPIELSIVHRSICLWGSYQKPEPSADIERGPAAIDLP